MNLRRVGRMRAILKSQLDSKEQGSQPSDTPEVGKGARRLTRTERIVAGAGLTVMSAGAVLSAGGLPGAESLKTFEAALKAPVSGQCQTTQLPPSHVISGKLADGSTWKATLGTAADELRGSGKLTPKTEALVCQVQVEGQSLGQAQVTALAGSNLSDKQKTAARATLKADAVAVAATHRLLSANDAATIDASELGQSFDAGVTQAKQESGAKLEGTWQALKAQEKKTAALELSRKNAYSAPDEQVLLEGLSAEELAQVPGAEAAGKDASLMKVTPLLAPAATAQASALHSLNLRMQKGLTSLEDRLTTEAAVEYVTFQLPVPAPVSEGIRAQLEAGVPFDRIQKAVTQKHLTEPGVLALHVDRAMKQVDALVNRMLPGTKPDAQMAAQVQKMVKEQATPAQINNAIVAQVVDLPAFHIAQLDAGAAVWKENAAATDCSVDAIVNVLGTLGVSGRTQELYDGAVAVEQFNTRSSIPGGPFVGERAIALAKQKGITLEGYFNATPELGPMREALQNGYAILVNGNVRGSTAGHFLVVQKVNSDGSFKMDDSVLTEYAANSISPAELNDFTHNGSNPPGFYALKISHDDMMKMYGSKFLIDEATPVA